jgi:hypothetical protein
MISSETPYKLAEIIRNTWPQLYMSFKRDYNNLIDENKNDKRNIQQSI